MIPVCSRIETIVLRSVLSSSWPDIYGTPQPFARHILLEGIMRKLSVEGSKAIQLRVPPAQLARIDRSAKRGGKSLSAEIRELINLGFEARAIEHLIGAGEPEGIKAKRQ